MFQSNISLKPYNTFGIEAIAKYFDAFNSVDALQIIVHEIKDSRHLILGGGSNLLFTSDFNGIVLKNEIKGIEKIKEDEEHVWLKAGAGENWHQFVLHCIQNNWAGVENLSLIPGCVGASPMQNIGAYGVEIKDVFEELDAYHINENITVKFNLNDCAFGYRESVFKNKYKGKFVITHVTFKLNKKPNFNTNYGAIEQQLEQMGVKYLSIKAISDAVISIRQSKLPDPALIGNAGSFFKNPTIPTARYVKLKEQYKDIPGYASSIVNRESAVDTSVTGRRKSEVEEVSTKIPAGWLIEQCGWKGYRNGDAGVHPKQALVLVNYKNASGQAIYDLSTAILTSVKQKFGIELEREVNIISDL